MDIPLDASVECSDGPVGTLTNIIVNPATETITHLVVSEHGLIGSKRLLSEALVKESTHDTVFLSISKREFQEQEEFVQTEFLPSDVPAFMSDEYLAWPMQEWVPPILQHEAVPPGEFSVRRNAKVYASDGHVGRVDEFLVEKKSGHITHLVLREGHLWGKKDVSVPVDQIDRYEDKCVYLKTDKKSIEDLPPVHIDKKDK
jgi:sporulation protein YlmC with PRC-barrel domain